MFRARIIHTLCKDKEHKLYKKHIKLTKRNEKKRNEKKRNEKKEKSTTVTNLIFFTYIDFEIKSLLMQKYICQIKLQNFYYYDMQLVWNHIC